MQALRAVGNVLAGLVGVVKTARRKTKFFAAPFYSRGISFIELIVAITVFTLVFGGLFSMLQLSIQVISQSKAEAGAVALATERMEYIRSLSYNAAGTQTGFPTGSIANTSTTTLNGINYTETVLIEYVDDDADGLAGADTNSITTDYKRVKVTFSWKLRDGETDSLSLTSNIVPRGIESNVGGGTLVVEVRDKLVQALGGATVRVYNDTGTSTYDVTKTTGTVGSALGIASFAVPANTDYEVTVSRAGYSGDATYALSATNTNPSPRHATVEESLSTSLTFFIDQLSDLTIRAINEPTIGLFSDTFADDTQLFSTSSTQVVGGSVTLSGAPGSYPGSGIALGTSTAPSTINAWELFDFEATTPASTSVAVRLYSVTGSTYTIIPDIDLAGNTAGFSDGPIDLRLLDPVVYPEVALGVVLTSSSSAVTPSIEDWEIQHVVSESPIVGVDYDVQGQKTIGTFGSDPVYKNPGGTFTTDSNGEITLTQYEYDSYDIVIDDTSGYTVVTVDGADPFELEPGTAQTITYTLRPSTPHSLRVSVTDVNDVVLSGASVQVESTSLGLNVTEDTDLDGQAFFSTGIGVASDYEVTVRKVGYEDGVLTNQDVDGDTVLSVSLAEGDSSLGQPPAEDFLSGYSTRVPLTFESTAMAGDVTDFPVYVRLSDLPAAFWSGVRTDGGDIRITTDDGITEVPRELVSIDTSGQTGELHFKAPVLSISSTTIYYLYYGNSGNTDYAITDTNGAQNVWTNNYALVYHFEESGSGALNEFTDSTANGFHGQGGGGSSGSVPSLDSSGQLGNAQNFDGSNDYIDSLTDVSTLGLSGVSSRSVTVWAKVESWNNGGVFGGGANSNSQEFAFRARNNTEQWRIHHKNNTFNNTFNTTGTQNTWTHFGIDYNGSISVGYVDGVDIAQKTMTINTQDGQTLRIGRRRNNEFDGSIDEFRLANSSRSQGWYGNEYANQSNPTGFYTVGAEETN